MEEYICYHNGSEIKINSFCGNGDTLRNKKKISAVRCRSLTSPSVQCRNHDVPIVEISPQELKTASPCLKCCDDICYASFGGISGGGSENFAGDINVTTSAVLGAFFLLLIIPFAVFVYRRRHKRKRSRSCNVTRPQRYVNIPTMLEAPETPPPLPPRRTNSFQSRGSFSENEGSVKSNIISKTNTCGLSPAVATSEPRVSQRPLSIRRPSSSSATMITDLHAPSLGACAPPLPARWSCSAHSDAGSSSTACDIDSDTLEQTRETAVCMLGLDPAYGISRLVRELETSTQKKKRRRTKSALTSNRNGHHRHHRSHRLSSVF